MKWQAVVLGVVIPGVCWGQAVPAPAAAPHMVRAAGMPLHDGTLPPGTLTVRLVQGAFIQNLDDRLVEVEVAGGKIDAARTGADGRAQFAHLPVGGRVRAGTTINGERLESDPFEMPATSGVRVLLVAGGDDGPAVAPAGHGSIIWPGATATAAVSSPPPRIAGRVPAPGDPGVAAIRAVLATTTVLAFGAFLFTRRTRAA